MKKDEWKVRVELGYRVYGPEEKLLFATRSYAEMVNFVLGKREQIKPLKVVEAFREVHHVEIVTRTTVEEEIDVFWEHAHEES